MKNKVAKIAVLVITALIMAGCFVILTVSQPSSVMGLEQFTASLSVEVTGQADANPHYAIVGLKLPNDWQVDSVWFTGAYNDYCTFLHPDSSDSEPGGAVDYWTDSLEARYPSGSDMQWLVYESSTSHLTLNSTDTVDVFVKMTPGLTQGNFDLGYFVTDAALDFSDPTWYAASLNNPITVSGVVPVELTSFSAVGTRNGVQLNWQTATEINNQRFEIERSNDSQNFTLVGFVNGRGTTTEKSSYSFVDKGINEGKYYYRLKQVDYNGAYEYSQVIEVEFSVPKEFVLAQNYPNPFNPATTLSFGLPVESNITLSVYNSLGELVKVVAQGTLQAGTHNMNFDAVDLPSGIYLYTLNAKGTDGVEFTQTAKMLLLK
ncbi:MAG: T9SS type A sorting domain-containing protein [Ignavibacteriaceae bacterium]